MRSCRLFAVVIILGLSLVQHASAQGVVDSAVSLLQSGQSSWGEAQLAASILCCQPPRAREVAVGFSSHPDWSKRRLSALIWSGLGPDVALANAVTIHGLHRDPIWAVREATYIGLSGGLASDVSLTALDVGLRDAVWRVRLAALQALSRWPLGHGGRIESRLVAAAGDADPIVRKTAIRALCKYGVAGRQALQVLRDGLLDGSLSLAVRRACWLRLNERGAQFDAGLEAEGSLTEILLSASLANTQQEESAARDAQLLDLISHSEARHVLGQRILNLLIERLCRGEFIAGELKSCLLTPAERGLFTAVLSEPTSDWPRHVLMRDLAHAFVVAADPIDVLLDEISRTSSARVRDACCALLLENRGQDQLVPQWMGRAFDIWHGLSDSPDAEVLVQLLRHKGRDIRTRAVIAMVRGDKSRSRSEFLLEFLSQNQGEILLFVGVAEELAKSPRVEYASFFTALAEGGTSDRVRLSGIRGLETLPNEVSAPILHELVVKSPHVEVQTRALAHLLSVGDNRAMASLLRRLRSLTTGRPSLSDVLLMKTAAPTSELTEVIQSFVTNGLFADESLPGMLEALHESMTNADFVLLAIGAVTRGIQGERCVLSGNTVRHLLLTYQLDGALPEAIRAFRRGHIRIPEAVIEGVVELASRAGASVPVGEALLETFRALGSAPLNAERRAAMLQGLAKLAGHEGRGVVQARLVRALRELSVGGAAGDGDLDVASEVVEGIAALLEWGNEGESTAVVELIAEFIEAHVERRLASPAIRGSDVVADAQLLQLLLAGFSTESYSATERALESMFTRHPAVAAFIAHELYPDWLSSLGPRSGQTAPCATLARLTLSHERHLGIGSVADHLILVRCLLSRDTAADAGLASCIIDALERWRLGGASTDADRNTSFLRMRASAPIAFDPRPLSIARVLAGVQRGQGVERVHWNSLREQGSWMDLLPLIRQLRRDGACDRARELLDSLESHAAREESYLLERVKVLLSEKRWVAAIDVASGLANRLSLSRPAVSAHLRVLEAAGAWQARDRQRAIEALHLADATHPAGKIDLMSDPEVLFWLDGLTASEWRRSRKR